jgi:serine/threonine protein kinase
VIPVLLPVDITGSKEPQVDDDCGPIERIIPATIMALNPGTRLGPYEVLSLIGAGGRGEMYKAKDTRLGRTVAIKVAKDNFTERFEREARAVAALNHPNICSLYDVGPNYLVMEYLAGERLSGPLPADVALRHLQEVNH